MFSKVNNVLLIITTFFIVAFLSSLTCLYAIAFPPIFIYYLFEATGILLTGFFLVNLGLAVCASGRRVIHLKISLLIMVAFFGMVAIPKLIGNAQEKWFLQNGRREYEQKIDQAKSELTADERSLSDRFGRAGVWGKTNLDGSVLVIFQGCGGWTRQGYMYYSGDQMVSRSGNSNILFFPDVPHKFYSRITNHWYLILR